jgi:signal transduction histidine kinase
MQPPSRGSDPFAGRRWLAEIALVGVVAATRLVQYLLERADHDAPIGRAGVTAAVVLSALPLLARHRFPFAALLAVGGGELALVLLNLHGVPLALLIALYTVAEARDGRESVAALGLVGAGAMTVVAVFMDTPALVVMAGVSLVMAWTLGALQRARATLAVESRRRLELLDRERQVEAELAATEERSRIARELHDVVAHGVSVMTMHAAGAGLAVGDDPDRAREAMAEVERTGRRSLSELRRLLGLLDRETAVAELAPQPGLARLDDLVEEFRRAELPVDVEIEGEPRELPSGVDLSAFRIIQEALTNVLKHAGRVPVRVKLCYRSDQLAIEVENAADGDGAAITPPGAGRGLVGMRERVALLGGRLIACPERGCFRVRCELPLTDT